jgi:hypothetical protein
VTSLVLFAALTAASDGGIASYPDAKRAFADAIASKPEVLAIGEYHEIDGAAPKVKSALKRFTTELLPSLKGRAGALIVETWMTTGRCGEVEKAATAAVAKTTQRPKSTENELETLLNKSYGLGLKNHILLISCDEYKSMLGDDGELDGEKSLTLVKNKLEEKTIEAREKGEGAVVIYGGALHNDLQPAEGFEGVTFGPALRRETNGRYLELDLLVPEYVEKDEDLLKEPWFKPALELSAKGKAVLVTTGPDSRVIVFPRTKR